MTSFVHTDPPPRVVFGVGTLAAAGAELGRLSVVRAVVLSTAGQAALADRVAGALDGRAAGTLPTAVPHTPVEVTERAVAAVRRLGGDAVVSVGGGSTTGLGKAVASRLGIRHLVVPTTYAGSEVTPVLGETAGGEKTTRSGPEILPDTVVYDVELTRGLPWSVTLTSAVNAMAHAVEALYGPGATADGDARALAAMRSLASGLRALPGNLRDLGPRADLLYGAWLAGRCLAAGGMGLHHRLAHVLGGSFDLPHAATHAVLLPYVMAFNEPAAGTAMARIGEALAADDAPGAIQSLVWELGGPTSLAELGLRETDLGRAADLAVARPYPNPRPAGRADLLALLTAAWAGEPVRPGQTPRRAGPDH